ncbi:MULTISPECIES: post-transcriptional regulator [Terrabacteria group]|uniref:post-transcriptional regulator n=1 Tax=Bacillati TaxID=1783272 RepID=UPI001939728E|nr:MULTISPECIES: post-transcriptional regulator [Terrabacteria group]MBW9212296.1 post-transcriptional regulator [Trueperella sp. zg.1013]QRG86166.1 hypothetical protein JOS54_04640 [Bulleidia sp. zg-1006]
MNKEVFDVNHPSVQLAMVLKLEQMKRTQVPTLSYSDLEDYLTLFIWKNGISDSLTEAVDTIWKIEAKDIIRFLSVQAIREGAKMPITDFSEMIGG